MFAVCSNTGGWLSAKVRSARGHSPAQTFRPVIDWRDCAGTVRETATKISRQEPTRRQRFPAFCWAYYSRRELVGVAGYIALITQRSVVQIHPPQPRTHT